MINISSMIPTCTKVKKVFEVGLEDEGEKLTKASSSEASEPKLSKKRYFSDLDQRKQILERKAGILIFSTTKSFNTLQRIDNQLLKAVKNKKSNNREYKD